jgi:large subunit ribosomal protein L21
MWPVLWKRWLELCCWWMPKTDRPQEQEEAATPTEPVDEPSAPVKEANEPEQAAEAPPADDLTQIKGIGPALQKKLAAQQIRAFADLAGADAETLTDRLKASQPLSVGAVEGWIAAARERTGSQI